MALDCLPVSLPMDLMGPAIEDSGAGPTPTAARTRPDPGAVALGDGVPAAIGAKIAQPDRPVVAVVGDGGFMSSVRARDRGESRSSS